MSILLTNDDGIYSAGIEAAWKALKEVDEVTIVAPVLQRSAYGRSISIFEPLRITEVKLPYGAKGYAVGGTPADCVILGVFALLKKKPDVMVSGINVGENVSTDSAMTSGTMGAAFEAAGYGIPSIAISIQVEEEKHKFGDGRGYEKGLEICGRILKRVVDNVMRKGMPEGVDVLNINVPCNAGEDTDVVVTRLARKVFNTDVEMRQDPKGRPYYWISGDIIRDGEEGTDCWAIYVKKCISVTPLSLDMSVDIKESKILNLFM
jgi:5'-nucleotidase